jgi:hypothetical protein
MRYVIAGSVLPVIARQKGDEIYEQTTGKTKDKVIT